MGKPEDRVDRVVSDLLRGRRLKLGAGDADEKAAITIAARLVGAYQASHHLSPSLRKRLARAMQDEPIEGLLTRRTALVTGLGLAVGAVSGGLIGRSLQSRPAGHAGGDLINPVNGRWIDVAALTELVEGEGKRVQAGDIGAFLFRDGETVTAVSSVCSHVPCELHWDSANWLLACPCHPATFMPDGTSTDRRYPLPKLSWLTVRITRAGRVEVLGTA